MLLCGFGDEAIGVEGGFGVLAPARGVEVRVEVQQRRECGVLLKNNMGEFDG